jgi:hypothetical protein
MIDTDFPGLSTEEKMDLAAAIAAGVKLNDNEFQFTSYADEIAHQKIDYTAFDRLNSMLSLKDFGEGIKVVGFAFIAMASKFFPQKQHIEYYPNYQRVQISLELNYEQFLEATPEAAINMMKELYLNGLRVIPLFNIKDFDIQGFIAAVEDALAEPIEE